MVTMSYVDFIDCYQNNDTISLIGKIDTNILRINKIESLFYAFPLIERMVLEIFKLVPGTDVEQYEQGTMKTIMSIIDYNSSYNILPQGIISMIERYFGKEGARNKLFHIKDEKQIIKVSYEEINILILELLKILKDRLKEVNNFEFKNVEHLK